MKNIKRLGILLIWLLVWQIAALIIRNDILFAGPVQTIGSLVRLSGEETFFASILASYWHIMLGILLGIIGGLVLAGLSYKFGIVGEFLSPVIHLMKAVPVASFVVLFLIWMGNENLSTIISFLVVMPIVYTSVINGLKTSAFDLLEMAHVYRMPEINRIRYIYIPSLIPAFKSAVSLSVGMGFKSGVAAEVIGQPLNSMGNGLYNAKIYLNTGDLFAWTFAIVLISWLTEKIVILLLSLLKGGQKNDD